MWFWFAELHSASCFICYWGDDRLKVVFVWVEQPLGGRFRSSATSSASLCSIRSRISWADHCSYHSAGTWIRRLVKNS